MHHTATQRPPWRQRSPPPWTHGLRAWSTTKREGVLRRRRVAPPQTSEPRISRTHLGSPILAAIARRRFLDAWQQDGSAVDPPGGRRARRARSSLRRPGSPGRCRSNQRLLARHRHRLRRRSSAQRATGARGLSGHADVECACFSTNDDEDSACVVCQGRSRACGTVTRRHEALMADRVRPGTARARARGRAPRRAGPRPLAAIWTGDQSGDQSGPTLHLQLRDPRARPASRSRTAATPKKLTRVEISGIGPPVINGLKSRTSRS